MALTTRVQLFAIFCLADVKRRTMSFDVICYAMKIEIACGFKWRNVLNKIELHTSEHSERQRERENTTKKKTTKITEKSECRMETKLKLKVIRV